MLQKGTQEYKNAQSLANQLRSLAETERWNDNSYFGIALQKLDDFLFAIQKTKSFASQIAKTIEASINPYGYKVASISDKQAWILATTAVENNIEL